MQLGVEDSWPPYADMYGMGISRNIVEAALASVQQPVAFEVKPYARVLRDIQSGQLHGGFNVARQDSTESLFFFGEEPLLQATASFYFSPQNPLNFQDHQSIPDGTRIGLIINYEYGDAYELQRDRFSEYRVNTQLQIVKMLLSGRVDMAIMYDQVKTYTLKQLGLPQDALVQGAINHESDIYVAFSRSFPEAPLFAKQLDAGLRLIRQKDEYQKLLNGFD